MDTSPQKQAMGSESPEQLLDAFKAAALSVTRLYKTSAAAQAKARSDGYQDCLDDLLAFLDRENIGLGDGEGWKIRRWATERLDGAGAGSGRDAASQPPESEEDDADKAETASSPEMQRSSLVPASYPAAAAAAAAPMRTDSAPPPSTIPAAVAAESAGTSPTEDVHITTVPTVHTVPTQDTFSFQSSIPYPQEPNLNLAGLDLSDSRPQDGSSQQQQQQSQLSSVVPLHSRLARGRHNSSTTRNAGRTANRLGRGAGQKRRMGDDLADIFNIGSLGYNGKDFFGGGKRSRHA